MPAPAATPAPSLPPMVRLAAPVAAGVLATAQPPQTGRLPLPATLLICPWGTSTDLAGDPVTVNEVTLRELAANQTRYGFDEVALDFSHNTTPRTGEDGLPLPTAEPLPIAGMGRLSVEPGRGIVYTPTSWTVEGEQYYCGRHYRDLSPTVGKTAAGEVNFIHSVALTRAGQISGLHAFSAPALPALTSLSHTPTMETPTTDYKALLLTALGIMDADATDETILAACAAHKSDKVDPIDGPPVTPLGADNLVVLNARIDELHKATLVAEASRAGKVIALSAENIKLLPLWVLQDVIANTPATVPLGATTPPAAAAPAVQALSADEAAVAARFGYSAEQFRAL